MQVSFRKYVTEVDVIFDIVEFHLGFAAGLEVGNYRLGHRIKVLNLLDFFRLDNAVELVVLVVDLHLHRHERNAVNRDVIIIELNGIGLLRNILDDKHLVRSFYQLVGIFFQAPAGDVLI